MEKPTISALFNDAAKKLRSDFEYIRTSNPHAGEKGTEAEDILRIFLNQHLPQRFRAASGFIIDNENNISSQTDVIIYDALASPVYRYSNKTLILPADTVASVIEVKSRLNKSDLEDAYKKIASCKSLRKRPLSDADQKATGSDLSTIATFGAVFGFDSDTSLATLAKHIEELNRQYDSPLWPDMVLVLDKGVINYLCQFPGEEPGGDLMPRDSDHFILAPLYVNLVIRDERLFSLNRFFITLLSHLTFYPRRVSTPAFETILKGAGTRGTSVTVYQHNKERKLVPAPASAYSESTVAPPLLIKFQGDDGTELGIMQFIPWLDGGAIKWRGRIPLEGLLVLVVPSSALEHKLQWEGNEFSTVFSITEAEFKQWPEKFNQKLTGMKASLVQRKMNHVFDEDTREPFIARLFLSILGIRDKTFGSQQMREKFDTNYDPVIKALMSARIPLSRLRNLAQTVPEKDRACSSPDKNEGTSDASRTDDLRNLIRYLSTAMKGMIGVFAVFEIDLAFIFTDDAGFAKGLEHLANERPSLADYLGRTREWLLKLLNADATGTTQESEISQASDGADTLFSKVALFVENTCAYLFKSQLPASLVIREIPVEGRRQENPQRFEVTLNSGEFIPWEISYSHKNFNNN